MRPWRIQDEYVRAGAERLIHTNTVEGFYSTFKRGSTGRK
jgi:hypothetical protein